ncbi:MAG: pentapeptide repeat-containing protein, partial [Deltaproteobacteria bacterium]|nr:pentapeptide repeat-containing protein [Deltaproteobacteria bacterium]
NLQKAGLFRANLQKANLSGANLLRLNLVVPGLNLKDPESLTITGKEKCRQKQGLQLAA